jgi:phosphate transport system substrate-binding protein
MWRAKRAIAIVTFTLVSCSSQVIPANTPAATPTTLRLYGTTATLPLIQDLTSAYSLTHPNIIFETQVGNYESMIDRVMQLEMPYFVTTHLPIESPLLGYPIGQDGIAVILHPDNPIASLTVEQVRQIYEGEITNWHEIGGSDLPIEVISREDGSATREEFESQVMGTRQTTLLARLAPSSSAVVISVASLVNAVGYVSISYIDDRVRAVSLEGIEAIQENVANNTYPLRSIIYVAGVEEPVTDFRAFIAWIQSPDGQAVVAQQYAPAP